MFFFYGFLLFLTFRSVLILSKKTAVFDTVILMSGGDIKVTVSLQTNNHLVSTYTFPFRPEIS